MATSTIAKLEQNRIDANHKIKMLRQQQRRGHDIPQDVLQGVDLAEFPCEEDGTTLNEVRSQLALLQEQQQLEEMRLSQLITGSGKGKGKSLEFEFAARTILATGCSARAARDQLLVSAQLFFANRQI